MLIIEYLCTLYKYGRQNIAAGTLIGMKTILFAATYGESVRSEPYIDMQWNLEEAGFAVELVQPTWRGRAGRTARGVADQLQAVYSKYPDPSEVILGGYYAGAVAAMHVVARQSEDRKPAGLVVASVAPLFREDLASHQLTAELLWQGYSTSQLQSYSKRSFADLAGKITCNTQLFIGRRDGEETIYRSEQAEEQLAMAQVTCADFPETKNTHPLYYGSVMQAHLSTVDFSPL